MSIVLTILQELFTPKDRLDYRYFYKRAYYLGTVKAALERSAAGGAGPLQGAQVDWQSEDERRPVVAITVGKGEPLFLRISLRLGSKS